MLMAKVLLTSTCRPFGPGAGDAPSVGYELLHSQVTRAQGLFSPRSLHLFFGLEYIAENLEAETVVLHYPSRRELIKELRRQRYDYVGVSFIIPVFHKLKETAALIREHAPGAKIVLGGYGTLLPDEVLKPFGDVICREEGVAFFRKLLGEPEIPMPYRHPLIVSRLKLFSLPVSKTGMIFAGLGCPNGCDFCCTSHFFQRRHIRLLPTGQDIFNVVSRYLDRDPAMSFVILDEDFLLNKKRALEFRDCVAADGRPISLFAFSSIRAISQYTMEEILEMGIDGFWIGYEATRSGYAKQQGRPPQELFRDLRDHGITVLASMIVGFDYQDEDVVAKELDGLLELDPCLSQFLIYAPMMGTPFHKRIVAEGRLRDDLAAQPELYYRKADGFAAMVKHPRLSAQRIEALQRRCFDEDFRRLGPSIYRVIDRWLRGYLKLKDSPNPLLRAKAGRFANDLRSSYAAFLPGKLLGPSREARARVARLQREVHQALGRPTVAERLASGLAVAAAAWTSLTLRLGWRQHPGLTRTAYRVPQPAWQGFAAWKALASRAQEGLRVTAELEHPRRLVWLRLEGSLAAAQADALWSRVRAAAEEARAKIVLDLKDLKWEPGAVARAAWVLRRHRRRIRVIAPRLAAAHPEVLLLIQAFRLYNDGFRG